MSDKTNIYRINNAGAYFIGHFNTYRFRLELGDPHTCMCINEISYECLSKLLRILKVDWEDGDYLQNLLKGKLVLIQFNEKGVAEKIGTPYNAYECVEIEHGL